MTDVPEPLFTVRLRRGRAYTGLGKLLLVVVIGVLFGLAVSATDRRDRERAAALTREQYAADYDSYKARLMHEGFSPAASAITGVAVIGLVFGVYELLGFGIGWVIGRLADRERNDPGAARAQGAT